MAPPLRRQVLTTTATANWQHDDYFQNSGSNSTPGHNHPIVMQNIGITSQHSGDTRSQQYPQPSMLKNNQPQNGDSNQQVAHIKNMATPA